MGRGSLELQARDNQIKTTDKYESILRLAKNSWCQAPFTFCCLNLMRCEITLAWWGQRPSLDTLDTLYNHISLKPYVTPYCPINVIISASFHNDTEFIPTQGFIEAASYAVLPPPPLSSFDFMATFKSFAKPCTLYRQYKCDIFCLLPHWQQVHSYPEVYWGSQLCCPSPSLSFITWFYGHL